MRVFNNSRPSYQVLLLSFYFGLLTNNDARSTCVKFKDNHGLGRLARRSISPEKQVAESVTQIPSAGHDQDTVMDTAKDLEPVAARSHPDDSKRPPTMDLRPGSVNRVSPKSSQSSEKSAFAAWRPAQPATKRKNNEAGEQAATSERTESRESEAIAGKRRKLGGEPEANRLDPSGPSHIEPSAELRTFEGAIPQSSQINEPAQKNYGSANTCPLSTIGGQEQGSYPQQSVILNSPNEQLLTTENPSTDPSKIITDEGFVDPIPQYNDPKLKRDFRELRIAIDEKTPSSSPDKVTRGEQSTSASGNRPEGSKLGLGDSFSKGNVVRLDQSPSPSLEGFSEHKSSSEGFEARSPPSQREISSSDPMELRLLHAPSPANWNEAALPDQQGFRSVLSERMGTESTAYEKGREIGSKHKKKIPNQPIPERDYQKGIQTITEMPDIPSKMTSLQIWAEYEEVHRLAEFNYETLYEYFKSIYNDMSPDQKSRVAGDDNFKSCLRYLKEYFQTGKRVAFENLPEKKELTLLIKSLKILEFVTGHPWTLGEHASGEPMLSSARFSRMATEEAPRAEIQGNIVSAKELTSHTKRTSSLATRARRMTSSKGIMPPEYTNLTRPPQPVKELPGGYHPGSAPEGHHDPGIYPIEAQPGAPDLTSRGTQSRTRPGISVVGQRKMVPREVLERIGSELKNRNNLEKEQIARLATAEGYKASIINLIQKYAPEHQGFMLLRPEIMKDHREILDLLTKNPHVNEKGEYHSLPFDQFFRRFFKHCQNTLYKTHNEMVRAWVAEGRDTCASQQLHKGTTASTTQGGQASPLIEAGDHGNTHNEKISSNIPTEDEFDEMTLWMSQVPEIDQLFKEMKKEMADKHSLALEQKGSDPNLGNTQPNLELQPSPPTLEHTFQKPPSSGPELISAQSNIKKSFVPQDHRAQTGLAPPEQTWIPGAQPPPLMQLIRNSEGKIYPVLVDPKQRVIPASDTGHGHQTQKYRQFNLGSQEHQQIGSRPIQSMIYPSPSVPPAPQAQAPFSQEIIKWLVERDQKIRMDKKSD